MEGLTRTAQLQAFDTDALEALYASAARGPVPRGVFRGTTLVRLTTPAANRALHLWSQRLLFEWVSWGIDFDNPAWFFTKRNIRGGRFRAVAQRSRWRDADVVALHYDVSRLPSPIRGLLYDEVLPLNESLCLGLGGINAEAPEGDHFFFALERIG